MTTNTKEDYSQKLKDPRWQKKRLEIFERDKWRCKLCDSTDKTLVVHHRYYEHGLDPWEYPDEALATLCEKCHGEEREAMAGALSSLASAAQRALWAGDIQALAGSLASMYPTNPDSLSMGLVRWMLERPDLHGKIIEALKAAGE